MLKQTLILTATALILSLAAANAQQAKSGQLRIPVPGAALLKPQPEPACEYKATDRVATGTPDTKAGDPAVDAALRTKLDYERQCYRHAEMILRQRLHALQASVRGTIGALKKEEAVRSRPPRRSAPAPQEDSP